MNINRCLLSFKANYLLPAKIQHLDSKNKKWVKSDACIVELNPQDSWDLNVLEELHKKWRANIGEFCFASDIYEDAYARAKNCSTEPEAEETFLAMTIQKDNFEKLIPEKILGISEVMTDTKNGYHELAYLQVHPEHTRNSHFREFKLVGSTLCDIIMDLFQKDITVVAEESTIDFYKMAGFVEKNLMSTNQLILKRK